VIDAAHHRAARVVQLGDAHRVTRCLAVQAHQAGSDSGAK
jgi:hypothetical protein